MSTLLKKLTSKINDEKNKAADNQDKKFEKLQDQQLYESVKERLSKDDALTKELTAIISKKKTMGMIPTPDEWKRRARKWSPT